MLPKKSNYFFIFIRFIFYNIVTAAICALIHLYIGALVKIVLSSSQSLERQILEISVPCSDFENKMQINRKKICYLKKYCYKASVFWVGM